MTNARTDPDVDLLTGLDAIGRAIGMGARQVQYLHEKGELPTFKLGAKVCARRSTLAQHFAAQEAAAAAAARDA